MCFNVLLVSLSRRYLGPLIHLSRYFSKKSSKFVPRKMDLNLRVRENPVVTILKREEYAAILTEDLVDLLDLFKKYKYEIRLAGGPVRDLLMKKIPSDIDLATTATPTQMKEMFTQEEVRMVNANGEKHGTITPRINDSSNFEVTTLRIDVTTDGRHAEVEFTTDWQLDANRRDLTINSMFMSLDDGTIYDYFFGFEDLQNRRVAFVGSAETRIQEDYLRILRYFRFYGRIAEVANNHEEDTLKAIKQNVAGLERISGERIWVELKKILQGRFTCELIKVMLECGMAKFIGLPEEPNIAEFERLCETKKNFDSSLNSATILSSLLWTPEDAVKLNERLKFSAFERDLIFYIIQNREQTRDVEKIVHFQKMCFQTIGKLSEMRSFVEQLLMYHNKKDLQQLLSQWEIPRFPVNGSVLKEHGCPSGRSMGIVMSALKEIWANEEFKSTTEDLLKHLPGILEKRESNRSPPLAQKKQRKI
ncbi:CCA tRNA nucleotidyltransferase 1, mitochondrial [Phlebotomus argentipes]|uniref:CCA tRNA nucleotidyltransferase 1, mitochondrial n=1 Tax=Phlebotomus argentipes TaxID=94469 RepID=UPI002892DA91|nr:CCA tRNA nucleotidyltransferase 1, mitochondrial [Phlebotomus argentipes]